jgi:hypothetical protein
MAGGKDGHLVYGKPVYFSLLAFPSGARNTTMRRKLTHGRMVLFADPHEGGSRTKFSLNKRTKMAKD